MIQRTQFRPQSTPENLSLPETVNLVNKRFRDVAQSLVLNPGVTQEQGVVNTDYPVGHVYRYGAVGDGIANDTTPLRYAMAYAQGAMLFPNAGTFLTTGEITYRAGVIVWGYGATIKLGAPRFRSCFYGSGINGMTIYGLAFDLGMSALPVYKASDDPNLYNVAVDCENGCANIKLVDVSWTNLYTRGVNITDSSTITITRPTGTSPVQTQISVLEHIRIGTCGGDIRIEDPTFTNAVPTSPASGVCGILMSGTTGYVTVVRPRFDYCGRDTTGGHQLDSLTFYGDHKHVVVEDLVSTNTMYGALRLGELGGGTVDGYTVTFAPNATPARQAVSVEATLSFLPGESKTHDLSILHGTITDSYQSGRVGVSLGAYDYSLPLTDILVEDLNCIGVAFPVSMGGPYQTVTFRDIKGAGANGPQIRVLQAPPGLVVTANNGVTEAQSVYNDMLIDSPTCAALTNATVPLDIDFTKSPAFSGTIGTITVQNPQFKTVVANTQAIVLRGTTASAQGNVVIRGGDLDTYTYGIDAANMGSLLIEQVSARNITTQFYLDGGGNGSTIIRNNPGYNPVGPSAVTVTASPMTYTAGHSPETLYVMGGTVSGITRGGITVATTTNQAITLSPNQAAIVTYTVAPTMSKDVL